MSESCIFCKILTGELDSSIVAGDEHAMAIMDIAPINPGHVLVIPRRHAVHLHDLSEDEAAHCMRLVYRLAATLPKTGIPCDGYNLIQANGAVAGQEVFHVHFHLLPRKPDDPLRLTLDPARPTFSREDLDAVANDIRKAMK